MAESENGHKIPERPGPGGSGGYPANRGVLAHALGGGGVRSGTHVGRVEVGAWPCRGIEGEAQQRNNIAQKGLDIGKAQRDGGGINNGDERKCATALWNAWLIPAL